ncbi:MAG: hypothetical protein AAF927_18890 [Bacteroidota bacterium]
MKPHLFLICFLSLATLLIACKQEPEDKAEDPPEEKALTMADIAGEWVSSAIRVEIKSLNGTEQDTIIEASEDTYPDVLGIKANFSVLNADGTYEDVYVLPNDSIERGNGTWSLGEGTITFTQVVPNDRVHTYQMMLDEQGNMKVSGKVDFDADGEQDDDFSGTSYKRQ